MAKGYRPVDRDQPFLLPPDMREWLPADHVVWLVIEAVLRLDTSAFHARRRTGGAGAAGYDPDMIVKLLVLAYANGITSSRRIERLCQQDVAFRVICAGRAPDHVTAARFRQQFAETAAGLFAQVLVLCARLGMGQVGGGARGGGGGGAGGRGWRGGRPRRARRRGRTGPRRGCGSSRPSWPRRTPRPTRARTPCSGRGGAATTSPATRAPGPGGSTRRWRRWRPSGGRGRSGTGTGPSGTPGRPAPSGPGPPPRPRAGGAGPRWPRPAWPGRRPPTRPRSRPGRPTPRPGGRAAA